MSESHSWGTDSSFRIQQSWLWTVWWTRSGTNVERPPEKGNKQAFLCILKQKCSQHKAPDRTRSEPTGSPASKSSPNASLGPGIKAFVARTRREPVLKNSAGHAFKKKHPLGCPHISKTFPFLSSAFLLRSWREEEHQKWKQVILQLRRRRHLSFFDKQMSEQRTFASHNPPLRSPHTSASLTTLLLKMLIQMIIWDFSMIKEGRGKNPLHLNNRTDDLCK